MPENQGFSTELGARDPRLRQNQTGSLGASAQGIRKVGALTPLPEGADLETIRQRLNQVIEIIKELR